MHIGMFWFARVCKVTCLHQQETDRAVMTVSHKQETPTFVLGKRKAQSEAEHVQHQKRKQN